MSREDRGARKSSALGGLEKHGYFEHRLLDLEAQDLASSVSLCWEGASVQM